MAEVWRSFLLDQGLHFEKKNEPGEALEGGGRGGVKLKKK